MPFRAPSSALIVSGLYVLEIVKGNFCSLTDCIINMYRVSIVYLGYMKIISGLIITITVIDLSSSNYKLELKQ